MKIYDKIQKITRNPDLHYSWLELTVRYPLLRYFFYVYRLHEIHSFVYRSSEDPLTTHSLYPPPQTFSIPRWTVSSHAHAMYHEAAAAASQQSRIPLKALGSPGTRNFNLPRSYNLPLACLTDKLDCEQERI